MPGNFVAGIADGVLLLCASLSIVYLILANVVTILFARRGEQFSVSAPQRSITVLKPVSGLEGELYEALASFCDQQYENFDVLFCVHDAGDPAVRVIERIIADFPHCRTSIAVGDNPLHRNPKIANLSKAASLARGDLIVIADSDIRVGPTYLRDIAAPFADERTGAVTCLYRGIAQDHIVSQLGAAAIEDNFAPSVLVAATLGTMRFCLGATMAVRRTVLDGIGGIDALGPFLADDHKLGELVTAAGHRIVLSRYVVATGVPETTLRSLWSHELRWARTNLVLAPAGYTFSFLMYALPLSALYLACSLNARIGVPLVLTALVLRICLHAVSRTALGVARPFGGLLLVPLRDAFSFGVWFASFFGRSVRWRDVHVGVATDGQLT